VSAVHALSDWAKRLARRRSFQVAAAVVAVAVAVLAALLAQDVRSWRTTIREDAIRYAISPSAQEQRTARTYLPAAVSSRLLSVDRDLRWHSALRLFALANAVDISSGLTPRTEQLLQTAEKALSRAAQDPNPARASQAYALLSVILFKDSRGRFTQDLAASAASISAMQNAVRADGRNEKAEADLELLLRQFQADSAGASQQQANNQGPQGRRKGVGRGKGIPPVLAPGGDY
jgi:hypothetical protein